VKTVYKIDDDLLTIDDVKLVIPIAWDMPAVGEYIDINGCVLRTLPVGQWDVLSMDDAVLHYHYKNSNNISIEVPK
jgi:hypothetical protein